MTGLYTRFSLRLATPVKDGFDPDSKIVTLSLPSAILSAVAARPQIPLPMTTFQTCVHRVSHHAVYHTCSHSRKHKPPCKTWCRAVATTACHRCFQERKLCLILVDGDGKTSGQCECCFRDEKNGLGLLGVCGAVYNAAWDDKPTKLSRHPLLPTFTEGSAFVNHLNDPVLESFARQLAYDERIMERESRRKANKEGVLPQCTQEKIVEAEKMRDFTLDARKWYVETGKWAGGMDAEEFTFN